MRQTKTYVRTDEHGAMRIGQTRVLLESVIYAFQEGHSPESIRQQYPALSLEEVYGTITFYLASVSPEIGTAWKISGFSSESSSEDCRYEFYNRASIWDFHGIERRSSRRISHANALQSATALGLPAHRRDQTESELS